MLAATGKGGKYRYYVCAERHLEGKDRCKGIRVRREPLDEAVIDALLQFLTDDAVVEGVVMEFRNRANAENSQLEGQLRNFRTRIAALERQEKRIVEAVATGKLPPTLRSVKDKVEALIQERAALDESLKRLRQELHQNASAPNAAGLAEFRCAIEATFRDLDDDLRKALLDALDVTVHIEQFALKEGRSEEHTSELQSLMCISYAVSCLIKIKKYK